MKSRYLDKQNAQIEACKKNIDLFLDLKAKTNIECIDISLNVFDRTIPYYTLSPGSGIRTFAIIADNYTLQSVVIHSSEVLGVYLTIATKEAIFRITKDYTYQEFEAANIKEGKWKKELNGREQLGTWYKVSYQSGDWSYKPIRQLSEVADKESRIKELIVELRPFLGG